MKVVAACSMLHEPAASSSASRLFRGSPVLAWTLERLSKASALEQIAILCWDDQYAQVEPIAAEMDAFCLVKSGRNSNVHLNALEAAARWSDGWRGGLLGCCAFDRGFYGQWMLDIQQELSADALLLVDPASALIDPSLLDQLIEYADANTDLDLYFSPAAPGLSGAIIRPNLLRQLAAGNLHPGALLAYRPDLPLRDPIASRSCVSIPAPLARTTHRFALDSARQIGRIGRATEPLNGELISSNATQILDLVRQTPDDTNLPRDIVLELNVKRRTIPLYSPIAHLSIDRCDLSIDCAKRIFDQLAGVDDLRLTLGGVGDPLIHPEFFEIIELARSAGISAISVETDLLGAIDPKLANRGIDIISVFMPAVTSKMYRAMMGVDGLAECLANLRLLIEKRNGSPLIVPVFVKMRENLGEMEAWYDHWMRALGAAVIAGPTDFAGKIPDLSVADMSPPLRKPCARIQQRLTILSDGSITTCEQDILGERSLGNISCDPIADIWTGPMAALRRDHASAAFQNHPLCAACKEWDRP